MEEELYGTRYQSGSFSLIYVGSGFQCLRSFFFFFFFFWSRRKVAGASWLFKTDAVACCTTLSMCLSSYIGWQMEDPVNCVKKASVLGPNTLPVRLLCGLSRSLEALGLSLEVRPFFVTRAWLWKGCHVMGGQCPTM